MSAICVSIGRGRHRHAIAEHQHLVQQGAQLVELRVDCIQSEVNLTRLLKDRPGPVIVTCRRQRDGGHWQKSEAERVMLLRQAIAMGVEYIDLEEDIAAEIPPFGKTKRIVSLHNFHETPDDLAEIHKRLAGLKADVVKIATMAHSPHDNVRMLQLVKQASLPTVGLCMGDVGTPSRVLAGKFGAPFSFATLNAERTLAPGQLTFDQMKQIYRYETIGPETEVYGVIADPVGHSLSPLIHNAGFAQLKLNKVYLPFRVPREHLAQFIADAPTLGIKGISVTIPHKEDILAHVKKADEASQQIGAANTVLFRDEGPVAYNTDYRAAMANIDQLFELDKNPQALAGKTCLVLGAGGVAHALVYGLKQRGADVAVSSRTLERAESLASRFACRSVAWSARHTLAPLLIINGTPVGMHPNVDETPYDAHHLRDGTAVFDTVYNPEQTLLIKSARDFNCKTITGVDMFVQQAALQFKLFTGHDLALEPLRQLLRRAINAARF
jgi:3-dehydroquinate dehydratase/shikimate dehydrogenase